MDNLQARNENQKLVNDIIQVVNSGFDDAGFLKIAKMLLSHVTPIDNPDAVYGEYPTLTQFVTEEQIRLGESFDLVRLPQH